MVCANCENNETGLSWVCANCGEELIGGVVLVTGISGSGVRKFLSKVIEKADEHGHPYMRHDIGHIMEKDASDSHAQVQWGKILDADEEALKLLRALSFREVAHQTALNPNHLHLVDLHLSFRWRPHLTKGFEPHIMDPFRSRVRLVVNALEDLMEVQERLSPTSWGKRKIRDLLYWRDEELFLADLYADMAGLERSYAIAVKEPPEMLERLIWHPEFKKVYLSSPMTALQDEPALLEEVDAFWARIQEFLIAFNPGAINDYDATYSDTEMSLVQWEVGDVTVERDYRFIDQADAVVVYYPKFVQSEGVVAEMRHAHKTGKDIYLYQPEKVDVGPFIVPPKHTGYDPNEFYELLKTELAPINKKTD